MPSAETLRRITLALLVLGCLLAIIGTALPSWMLGRDGTVGLWRMCIFRSKHGCIPFSCLKGSCTASRIFMVTGCLGVIAATIIMLLKYFKFPEKAILLKVTIGCSASAGILMICAIAAYAAYCVSIYKGFRSGAAFSITSIGMTLTLVGAGVAGCLITKENQERESLNPS